MEAYCVKCRQNRTMKDPKEVTMPNGRKAMQGTCEVCGTKMTRFMKSDSSGGSSAAGTGTGRK